MKLKNNTVILEYKNGNIRLNNVDDQLINQINSKINSKIKKKIKNYLEIDAIYYRYIITTLIKQKVKYIDNVKNYGEIKLENKHQKLRNYQQNALNKWLNTKWGIINFPTGSGKTVIAIFSIGAVKRSTLVLVPTIDLMEQWQKNLNLAFSKKIGLIGGGKNNVEDITISTYDSAIIYSNKIGNRFCFIIFDEAHHASSHIFSLKARDYIAPYRLGLTATMTEDPYSIKILSEIIGPVVIQKETDDLTGEYLSDYDLVIKEVELTKEERANYDKNRKIYTDFRNSLNLPPNFRWQFFIFRARNSKQGQKALESFKIQKSIAYNCSAKFIYLKKLINKYFNKKMLIFTNDNDSAKKISEDFNIPMIIHNTKTKTRKEFLDKFRNGEIYHLVSSRVLNEGIDVPDVKVAVVFSGSGTIREHRQRLGRLLRKSKDERALLVELVTKDTTEEFTSRRRNWVNNL